MVTPALVAHVMRGRVALHMMVPVVLLILVRAAHAIQGLGALNTQAQVDLLTMDRADPDTLAQEERHTMAPAVLHTMGQEVLVILAPVGRVIQAQEAQAGIALEFADREQASNINRVHSGCQQLRRLAP